MDTIDSVLENYLMREIHARLRVQLTASFPELASCPHQHFLALQKYVSSTPQKFYARPIYLSFLLWLNNQHSKNETHLKDYFTEHSAELNRSFLHLSEINLHDWHDDFGELDEYELIGFVDQQINPAYLRLVEAVFTPLLRVSAHFSRIDRGKSTDNLDIFNVVEELKRTDISETTNAYRHIMRNGIAHGGITYLDSDICYRDKQGNEERYPYTSVVKIFDELLDTCNALILALSVFLLSKQDNKYEHLHQLLLDELSEETKTPWWTVIGCTPSAYTHLNQLILHVRAKTFDYNKVLCSAFQTGVLAERFAPGYDRYFLSIRSNGSGPGFAAFNGQKLNQLRVNGQASLKSYQGVIEENLVFFVPRFSLPSFMNKIGIFLCYLRLHWPIRVADFQKQIGWANLTVRDAKIHRNAWGCVLTGSVYVSSSSSKITQDIIRKSCGRLIRKALSYARKNTARLDGVRYLPLGYARISIFCEDSRKRQLSGLGRNLVGTIQIQRIRRIKAPDILESTVERKGKYRIAWNRTWLDEMVVGNRAE
jgi:hypothetical protein